MTQVHFMNKQAANEDFDTIIQKLKVNFIEKDFTC